MSRVTQQQRELGIIPRVGEVEAFVSPLVERMARAEATPAAPPQATPDVLRPGEARRPGDGQMTALGRKRGPNLPDGTTVITKELDNMEALKRVNAKLNRTEYDLARMAIAHRMRKMPEWKAKVDKIMNTVESYKDACRICSGKGKPQCACEAYENLFVQFRDFYGDPRSSLVKDRKIIVGDKPADISSRFRKDPETPRIILNEND